jgi:predicted RNA binding protein YcfA (HicA-like mRNA interferase family)
MRTPRDVHGSEAVKALHRLGFASLRQTGSHHILRRDSKTVVVPMHRPIKPGTLRGLVEQAGVSMEEFIDAL